MNTFFVTDVRPNRQSKIDASLNPTNARPPRSLFAFRCVKGFVISVAIGLAASAASSLALPQEGASAATNSPKAKLIKTGKLAKGSKAVAKVSPKVVYLAAKALKVTKTPAARQAKNELTATASTKATRVLGASPPAMPNTSARDSRRAGKGYRVRSGDSLSSIAARQNTTVAALALANKLKVNSNLRIGQSLSLPKAELHGPKSLPTRLRSNPKRLAVRKHTAKWAKANDIPRDLLEATLWQESGFDQSKVSSTGAIGVGQIMPDTAGFIEKELIGVDLNPRVTENNVRMSARYLRYLLKANHSNTTKALHAYYQGMGSIRENGLYDDTIKYARNVQALRRHFEE